MLKQPFSIKIINRKKHSAFFEFVNITFGFIILTENLKPIDFHM